MLKYYAYILLASFIAGLASAVRSRNARTGILAIGSVCFLAVVFLTWPSSPAPPAPAAVLPEPGTRLLDPATSEHIGWVIGRDAHSKYTTPPGGPAIRVRFASTNVTCWTAWPVAKTRWQLGTLDPAAPLGVTEQEAREKQRLMETLAKELRDLQIQEAVRRASGRSSSLGPCTGSFPCLVCRDCSRCAHCSNGGQCGACKPR